MMSTPQVSILTSLPQEHVLLLAVIDRLLESGINFTGFEENQVPQEFTPELLNRKLFLADRGALQKLTPEQLKMVEEYSRHNQFRCFDYCGDKDNRTLANFDAEITVNGAIAEAGVVPEGANIPEQSEKRTLEFAVERAANYLSHADIPFSEFTVHNLRAVSAEQERLVELFVPLMEAQDPEAIPPHHDALGPWCFAPLCSKVTGDERYNKKFLYILDRTMAARPYTPEGLMAGGGNINDPLSLKGEFPFYEPHCIGREPVVYNEMFHFHGPLFAAATLASGDKRYLEHGMKLLRVLRGNNVDPADGLPCHYSRDGVRHGMKWSRGIAHILHGMTLMFEIWPDLPEAEAEEITRFADSIGEGLLRTQSESGLWHNIADEKTSPLESSGTLAFIASYQKLLNLHRLPESKYGAMIERARHALLRRCYRGGFAGNCAGTGLSLNPDYYFRRPFNFLFTGQIVAALEHA